MIGIPREPAENSICEIWKYQTPSTGTIVLDMPTGAKLLSVQAQNGFITLWALVQPHRPKEQRRLLVTGTGWPMERDPGTFVGTVQMGLFDWHVFEKIS